MMINATLIAELFEHSARSPSAHNTQPWAPRFVAATTPESPAEVHLAVDPGRTLPVGDPNSQDLHLAMGCWVESFIIAAAEVGLHVDIGSVRGRGPALEILLQLTPCPDRPGAPTSWPRFSSADLHHRQVDRGPMVRDDESFATAFGAAERALAASGMALVEVPHELWKTVLVRATRYSYSHKDIFTETLEWLRFNRRDPSYALDGLSAECLQIPQPLATVAARLNSATLRPWIGALTSAALAPADIMDTVRAAMRRRPTVGRHAPKKRIVPASAPTGAPMPLHHLVLVKDAATISAAPGSLAEQEIELGRNLLRIWLLLDRHHLRVDVHSEIKDCPQTRSQIADCLLRAHSVNAQPVAAFSVGTSTTEVPRSSRRPVETTHN